MKWHNKNRCKLDNSTQSSWLIRGDVALNLPYLAFSNKNSREIFRDKEGKQ